MEKILKENNAMSLLELRDIGKIYVSEGSTAVGIRGINLSFDLGEFVAITGKSGSGKTTLLNVMSGIDTYEEGEIYIEGESTSHYTQEDWEIYRKDYISFIFQDYNIIDSFTVLQNVELALSTLPDKKARRKRALELIDRVGLTPFKNSRGSKLSGGQKQRTVIARALAKDSPIILADEPTGNLDAQTSAEIIKLLYEISKDKLVIVVTHSFDELKDHATREIRIFDGSVEHDEVIRATEKKEFVHSEGTKSLGTVKRALELGVFRFFAKPKLSGFMCFLMILGAIGIFFATSLFIGNMFGNSSDSPMFTHVDGRVVLTRQDRKPFTESELEELVNTTGAVGYMHLDSILDRTEQISERVDNRSYYTVTLLKFEKNSKAKPDVGRSPTGEREAMLILPISFKEIYSGKSLDGEKLYICNGTVALDIVGIKYYYDNTVEYGKIVLTDEGFESLKYADFFNTDYYRKRSAMSLVAKKDGFTFANVSFEVIGIDPTLKGGEYYIAHGYDKVYSYIDEALLESPDGIEITYNVYNDDYVSGSAVLISSHLLEDPVFLKDKCFDTEERRSAIYISEEAAKKICGEAVKEGYTQASLFFESDRAARSEISALYDKGYIAAMSSATVKNDDIEAILNFTLSIISIGIWSLFIIFIAFFIYLCSARSFLSIQSDIAIMRSMGIGKSVLKISNYVYTLITLIPAVIALIIAATVIYTSPSLNRGFTFLHVPEYALIFIGLLLLVSRIAAKFNKKMFDQSVRRTLKGGDVK